MKEHAPVRSMPLLVISGVLLILAAVCIVAGMWITVADAINHTMDAAATYGARWLWVGLITAAIAVVLAFVGRDYSKRQ